MEISERQQILLELIRGTTLRNKVLWGSLDKMLDLGITNAQQNALIAIYEIDNCHINDVAQWLGVTNGAVTQLVDGLEKSGIVERRIDENDARKVRINITELGLSKLRAATFVYMNRFDEILKDMPTDKLKVLLEAQDIIIKYGEKNGYRS